MENAFYIATCRFHVKEKDRLLITGYFLDNRPDGNRIEIRLDGIQVKCQNLQEDPEAEIRIYLQDCENGETVAESVKKVGDIKTGKFNEFSFDTVTRCRGKAYKVVFEKDSIALYTEKTSEEGTNLKINSEESEGTLILKTVTYRFDIETFYVFLLLVLYICVFFQFLNWLFSR